MADRSVATGAEVLTPSEPETRAAREWIGMLVVGGISVVIDFGVFNALLASGLGAGWANLAALVVATAAAFWGNLRWSFAHRDVADPKRALVAFFVVNLLSAALVELGVVIAAVATADPLTLNAVKLALTIVATAARFVLYRSWVYRDSPDA